MTGSMALTLEQVDALFHSHDRKQAQQDGGDGEAALSSSSQERVDQLRQVLQTVQELQEAGSDGLDAMAEKIGNGSREASWRKAIGESGLLEFFATLIATSEKLRPALATHALRIIGNTCAYTNENRARVVPTGCLPKVISMLRDDNILPFAIAAVNNICLDYEPAQVAAYQAGLNPELVDILSGPRLQLAGSSVDIWNLLDLMILGLEPDLTHPDAPAVLLRLAVSPESLRDLDDFVGQAAAALYYLEGPTFRHNFLTTQNTVPLYLEAFRVACLHFDVSNANESDVKQRRLLQDKFNEVLSQLASDPLFIAACPLGGPVLQLLQDWLLWRPCSQLQSAAFLAFSYMMSDQLAIRFVQVESFHIPLIAIVSDPSFVDYSVLHYALGLLRNLAVPAPNKPIIGAAGILSFQVLSRFWNMDTQNQVYIGERNMSLELQFNAVELTRTLLAYCPENVRRICLPQNTIPDSPPQDRTLLHAVIGVFFRSKEERIKAEAARVVLNVLKVFHSSQSPAPATLLPPPPASATAVAPPPPSDAAPSSALHYRAAPDPSGRNSPLQQFYIDYDTIASCLVYLGTSEKKNLRSELWFVLALMARSSEGAPVAALCLQQRPLLRALLDAVGASDVALEDGVANLSLADADADADAKDNKHDNADAAAATDEGDGVTVSRIGGGGGTGGDGGGLDLVPQQPAGGNAGNDAALERASRDHGLVILDALMQRQPQALAGLLAEDKVREVLQRGWQGIVDERNADGAGQ